MIIVPLTKDLTNNAGLAALSKAHLKMQSDKFNFPDPDEVDYDWTSDRFPIVRYLRSGLVKGFALLDDNDMVQGYVIFITDMNIITGAAVLKVIAVIVATPYVHSIWAGRLINRVKQYAQENNIKAICWSINTDNPGEELFNKHQDRYKLIDKSYLELLG